MTNREIASKLGISPAALSLIINHKAGVSDETRIRVLNELKEIGYEHLIKDLPSVSTNNICFIIYKRHGEILDNHPFFLLLMENIENQARHYGYNIILNTVDKRYPIEPQIQRINDLGCKGAIIFATEMLDDDILYFKNLQIPFVSLDNDFSRLDCNTIAINNQMGTYQAINYLISLGLKRIGYLKSTIRISSFIERELGYQTALQSFGYNFLPEDILDVHYSEEGCYRDLRDYLSTKKDNSIAQAFVCDDDTIAGGAIRAFHEFGYKIPDDISIIGFNDRPSCEVTLPPLTTINVSKHAFAVEAVDELIRLINLPYSSESRCRKIRIGTRLVIRKSVKN
ncbi:hypothetical protein P261_01423 [Lachnospiraceae bacterium TWA4]|nr:hypothetical protein P261_01423 [Lachnospiraceae bacterium TWA4]